MMKKGEKNQGGLKVHDFFHGGYSKMYFKPAEESFFSGEGEWQVIEQFRCLRNPFTNPRFPFLFTGWWSIEYYRDRCIFLLFSRGDSHGTGDG
ncbi:hypothetical protein [Dialister succinatiphilus]|uniref:hypothetical protein n=1 Tax=Dialister succinatiphilus TaxID=487173 RepID=UPI004025C49B